MYLYLLYNLFIKYLEKIRQYLDVMYVSIDLWGFITRVNLDGEYWYKMFFSLRFNNIFFNNYNRVIPFFWNKEVDNFFLIS